MLELDTGLRKQLYDGILERLKTMPSPQREVFTLRHYHGQSDQEIARALGIEPTQVGLLLRQAESMIYQGVHVLRPPEE
jgi:DNA-directed RNA polymerase specialized sigma24 family protein